MLHIKGAHVSACGRSYRTLLRPKSPKQQPNLYRLSVQPLLFFSREAQHCPQLQLSAQIGPNSKLQPWQRRLDALPHPSRKWSRASARSLPTFSMKLRPRWVLVCRLGRDNLLSLQMEVQGLTRKCDDHLHQSIHPVHDQLKIKMSPVS